MGRQPQADTLPALLRATERQLLRGGLASARVEKICADAQLTKGAFFHYFPDKNTAVEAAARDFALRLREAFDSAPFLQVHAPLDRVYAYVDFTINIVRQSILREGCLVGLLAQELGRTPGAIRTLCTEVFEGWAGQLQNLLEAAWADRRGPGPSDMRSLALHFIAILEGSLLIARVSSDSRVVADSLTHFKQYIALQFEPETGSSPRHGGRTLRRRQ